MTIRFSCPCGALFEVEDQMAGRAGRCRNCGLEIVIPQRSEPTIQARPEPAFQPDEHEKQHTPQTRALFCPFCGKPTTPDAMICANCLKALRPDRPSLEERARLTLADWVVATALAPLGLVAGFISLVMGHRKGLDVMGVSTVSLFFWWLVLVVMGWLR